MVLDVDVEATIHSDRLLFVANYSPLKSDKVTIISECGAKIKIDFINGGLFYLK